MQGRILKVLNLMKLLTEWKKNFFQNFLGRNKKKEKVEKE